ncbi:TRAP transporter large permease [Pelagibacterium montanilacus]|uniref:TRAP transporter large permease n=1 Tax=Pelagibacterium montanilacus TaxID=2185280 RepID=UPI000F8DAF2F|nr:TRAP transporter large permease [Pelagibacterium montanilacus]
MILTLFGSFIVFLLLGLPVAFATGLASLLVVFTEPIVQERLLITRTFGGMDSFTLMAIPFFILAGEVMSRSGLTLKIVDLAMALVGHIRGGLAYVTVLANGLMACLSGTAAGSAAAIGSILIPSMIRQGYNPRLASLTNAFGSMMGPMIPPSMFMIIYGSMAGVSIGRLFLGGIIPGILIGLALAVLVSFLVRRESFKVETTKFSFRQVGISLRDASWAALMPILVVGGILGGITTPTEAGIIAVVYALFYGFVIARTLSFKALRELTMAAAITSANIMLVVGFAAVLGTILALGRFEQHVMDGLFAITTEPMIIIVILIFTLAFIGSVMDEVSTAVLFVPTLAAIGQQLGFDPVHFGVVMVLAIMTGAVNPPVGTLLFISNALARLKLSDILVQVWIFLIPILLVNILIAFVPELVTFLPSLY